MASGGVAPGERLSAAASRPLDLLCAAVRARVTGGGFDPATIAPEERAAFLDLAERHRVAPLFQALLPPDAPARARAIRSLAAVATLHRLLDAMHAASIPVLAWKGPALAVQAWGDPAARTFHDLDLVVPPSQVEAARRVVLALGWRPRHAMTAAQERAIFAGLGASEFVGEAEPPLLELHWAFSARRYAGRLDVDGVLTRATNVAIGGRLVPVPSLADTLALLAQHASKHGWSALEDLAVFAALAQREPRALVAAHARAHAVGGARALRLGAALMARALDLALPAELAEAVGRDATLPRLVETVEALWVRGETAWRPPLSWDLAWTERPLDRARLLARATFDPTLQEWTALPLPDALLPLYPVLRPFRRLWSALRR